MKTQKIVGALFLSVAACIWGGMFVVVKSIVGEIPPVQLVWLRYLVGAVALLVVILVKHVKWHWDARNVRLIILIGLVGEVISIVAQETGTWLASAQLGSVITTATPACMILFSWPLLKVKPKLGAWLSLIFATLGVVVIVGVHVTGKHVLLGSLFLLVAGVTWALMSVLIQLVAPKYDILQVTFLAIVVAIITLTPIIGVQHQVLFSIHWLSPHVIFSILYLGVISTAMAFVLWNQGLRLFKRNTAGMFFVLQPVTGALLSWLFLNEPIGLGFFIGVGFILGSMIITIKSN